MSDIDSVLEQVREHYLSAYVIEARNYKSKYESSSPEVLLEIGGREDKPYPYRLYRMDLMSGAVEPPNMTDFNNDSHLTFEPIAFTVEDKLSVTLSSFSWNAVEFESGCYDLESDLISSWALKWLNVEETNSTDENGFGGYIHSISYPEKNEDKCTFSVDFGSANIDSFYELINVFLELGIKDLAIHSNSYHV